MEKTRGEKIVKDKDKQEVSDIVMHSMIKAGIVKMPKAKPIELQMPSAPEMHDGIRSRIRLFGKKKPPSETIIKFNEFIRSECKHGCYLCDGCEERLRNFIFYAIEKGK